MAKVRVHVKFKSYLSNIKYFNLMITYYLFKALRRELDKAENLSKLIK